MLEVGLIISVRSMDVYVCTEYVWKRPYTARRIVAGDPHPE